MPGSEDLCGFLGRATRSLAVLPEDPAEALTIVAQTAVPVLADWCLLEMQDGDARCTILAHGDPRQAARVARLTQLPETERDRQIQPRGKMCVALAAGGRVIGTMTLMAESATRVFDARVLEAAETYAAVAACALDNRRLRLQAAEAEATHDAFLRAAIHAFRTPLHVVMGYADLLHAGIPDPLPDRARRQVEHIQRAAGHLLDRVEQALRFPTVPAALAAVDPLPVALDRVGHELAVLVAPLARARGIEFELRAPAAMSVVITDLAKLRQVLYQLLEQAIAATGSGSVLLEILTEDTGAVLQVTHPESAGTGEALEGIFDSPTHQLVRTLGGELSSVSAGGHTTTKLRLPLVLRKPEGQGQR